jgi:hypothetical protein
MALLPVLSLCSARKQQLPLLFSATLLPLCGKLPD